MRILLAFLWAANLFGSPARAGGESADVQAANATAFSAFLSGAFAPAADAYRRLVSLLPADAEPAVNLALALQEDGRPQDAAAHWLRAALLAPRDPYVWNQRGWNYLSMARYREARESFNAAIKLSTAAPAAAEGYLGLGLADSLEGRPRPAVPSLQQTVTHSPYLLPAASAELGRLALRLGKAPQAVPFLTMSLGQDPEQPDVARLLAEAYEKSSQTGAAWQAYKVVLDLDPDDGDAKAKAEKLSRFIAGRPSDTLPLRRLSRPLMREIHPEPSSPALRVGLFADPVSRLNFATHLFFMTSSDFRLADAKLGTIDAGKPNTQWEIIFRVDNRVVEVRDAFNNIHYVSKQPFRIEPSPGGTTLLKNPELSDIKGVDPGDRELRGVVEIIPAPMGFTLVNELGIEEYLFSATGRILPQDSPLEAYKALAVLMRSRLQEAKKIAPRNPERMDLCDSSAAPQAGMVACIPYLGLTEESILSSRAVRETRGVTLSPGAGLEYHSSCGWATRGGIQDRAVPDPAPGTPSDLDRLVHGYPKEGLFDDASARVPANWLRWLRVIDGAALRARADRIKPLGPIRRVRVAKRDTGGRILALEVSGPGGTLMLEGETAVASFLSPALRSTLAALQPLYSGHDIERLLVWGAGTGHGRGLCVAGAMGQAQLGADFKAILSRYFPNASFIGLPAEPRKPVQRFKPAGRGRGTDAGAVPRRRRRRPPVRHFASTAEPPQSSTSTKKAGGLEAEEEKP